MTQIIVSVKNLYKKYGEIQAVNGLDLAIEQGEIFGILGPNGAGKTTTIEILEGLRTPDSGEISIAGFCPQKKQAAFHQHIGVQLQHTAIFDKIRVGEAVHFFRSCYSHGNSAIELLERFSLKEKSKLFVKDLSGGEKQRLTLALALINDPQIIFLDEPTTGMDPHARRAIWDIITDCQAKGKTLLLTTHHMEEAERLCDRIAIIDQGKIIAQGTPRELIRNLGAEKKIIFNLPDHFNITSLHKQPDVSKVQQQGNEVIVFTAKPQKVLLKILTDLADDNLELQELQVSDANLEDVFIHLTGRKLS
jgi:ABC-2 type transport system ATP-binding protein